MSTSIAQVFIWCVLSTVIFPSPYTTPTPGRAGGMAAQINAQCECPTEAVTEPCVPARELERKKELAVRMDKEEEEGEMGLDYDSDERDYLEGLGVLKDSTHYLLVVLVLSSPKGKERRDAIRDTWKAYAKSEDFSVLVMFVVGTVGLSSSDMEALMLEKDLNHDLVFLSNLKESYYNLTLKVLKSIVWVDSNLKFSYLLKCDDDSFVMMHLIAEELSERTSERSLYWGFFDGRATPKKVGKYIEKDWFLCDRYLPYALGGGYVISADLVHKVALMSNGLRLYNNEDTSMGVWLSPFAMERKHDTRFNTEFVSRGCRNSYIVSHKQSIDDMHSKHFSLQHRGVLCEKEYQTRLSYEYDWSKEPSKCCERKMNVP